MRDRSHDPTTQAAREAGRSGARPSPPATAGGPAPGTAGAALVAAVFGALVLIGHAAPTAAQSTTPHEARAGEVENAAHFGSERAERAADERPEKILTGIVAAGEGAPATGAAAAGQEKTLYQRLGGLYPIASVVDVFIDLLLHNDVLNENPAIRKARDEVPTPGLKYHVTAMVCQATGGPCEYTGRSMKEAHAHLNIGEREWQAMLSDLRRTLNDFRVPEQEQEELVAIVQSTKDDIVVED